MAGRNKEACSSSVAWPLAEPTSNNETVLDGREIEIEVFAGVGDDAERHAETGIDGAGAIGADDQVLFAIPDVEGIRETVVRENVVLDIEPF